MSVDDASQIESTQTEDGESPNAVRTPSQLKDLELFNTLSNWFQLDRDHSQKWRIQAKEDFKFIAGQQWEEKDKRALEDQGRPVIVFNRALPILKSVAGIEINSRDDTVFLPAIVDDEEQVEANATLSAANKWMSEGCGAEDEQSEAFFDCLVSGMGWTEQRVDFEERFDGKYIEDRIYALEMYWDKDARKKNLKDAKRLFRLRTMTLAEAKDFLEALGIEGVDDEDIDATWAIESDANNEAPRPIEERRRREENAAQFDPKDTVRLVHAQWIERENYFKVAVPQQDGTTALKDMSEAQHGVVQKLATQHMGQPLKSMKCRRKVYKQAIIGAKILGKVTPVASRFGFTWACITGEADREAGIWSGIIAVLRDPQRWANKWLSQTLHILNTTAKGGILAEADAFEDIREAKATYARPDAITVVAPGAIQKGKIQEKPGAGIPSGYQGLLEFAISSIRDTTGINVEMLGMKDANQPGVVEAHRKAAAMTILATTFDALRGFRKIVGRNRLSFIQDYFSDGRLVRIRVSAGVYKGMRLIQDKTSGDYEVDINDAPTSPNQKEQIWDAFQGLMPVLQPYMAQNPEVALTVLEYSPIPSEVIQRLRDLSQQSQQSPDAQQAQANQKQAAQLALQDQAAEVQKKQAQTRKDLAQADHAEAQARREDALGMIDGIREAQELKHKRLIPFGPPAAQGGPIGGPSATQNGGMQ